MNKRGRKNEEFSIDTIIDIVSNSLGVIILIMIVITLLSFTRTYFSGNVESIETQSRLLVDEIDGNVIPRYRDEVNDKFPFIVICAENTAYLMDMDEFYNKVSDSILDNFYIPQMDLGEVTVEMSYLANEWMLNIQVNSGAGIGTQLLDFENHFNEIEFLKQFDIYDEDLNPNGLINKLYHYFYFYTDSESFEVYNSINDFLITKGFSTGVRLLPDDVIEGVEIVLTNGLMIENFDLPVQYWSE